jgi:hypothetical protein
VVDLSSCDNNRALGAVATPGAGSSHWSLECPSQSLEATTSQAPPTTSLALHDWSSLWT